ncbi:MAG: hypothetical protein H7A05_03400 [Pseudomonadales bacterium]|nr:hypothetical protein [Pseudomonadales bacterium]
MVQKSLKQVAALNKSRNSALGAVLLQDPGFSCQGKVGAFIGVYIQAEVFASKLQTYYCKDKKKTISKNLNITTLSAALLHFSIEFNEDDVRFIFLGGAGEKGKKSARQLRNGYLHALSQQDKNEIVEKYDALYMAINKFLSIKIGA